MRGHGGLHAGKHIHSDRESHTERCCRLGNGMDYVFSRLKIFKGDRTYKYRRMLNANFIGLLVTGIFLMMFYISYSRSLIAERDRRGFDLVFVGFMLGLITWGLVVLFEFRSTR